MCVASSETLQSSPIQSTLQYTSRPWDTMNQQRTILTRAPGPTPVRRKKVEVHCSSSTSGCLVEHTQHQVVMAHIAWDVNHCGDCLMCHSDTWCPFRKYPNDRQVVCCFVRSMSDNTCYVRAICLCLPNHGRVQDGRVPFTPVTRCMWLIVKFVHRTVCAAAQ